MKNYKLTMGKDYFYYLAPEKIDWQSLGVGAGILLMLIAWLLSL